MELYTWLSFVLNLVLLGFVLGYRARDRRHMAEGKRWRDAVKALRNIHREGLS